MAKKRIFFSIFLLILSICFITDVKALENTRNNNETSSRWNAVQPKRKVTSEGLIIDYDFSKMDIGPYWFEGSVTVNVTIPKDYDLDTIVISPDVFTEFAKNIYGDDKNNLYMSNTIQPGDKININFVINNLSSFTYNYDDTSFEIFPKEDIVYDKLSDNTSKSSLLFNGKTVNENYHVNRTYNTALKALIPNSSNKNMTDEIIDKALKDKGYTNGINDYTKYLLDFYNEKYSTNYTRLDQFPDGIIREILGENDPFTTTNSAYKDLGIFISMSTNIEDILSEVKSHGYNSIEEYLLKYYNEKYGTNATKLACLSDDALDDFFESYGMEQGFTYNIETNPDIIALSYDYFYNKGISFGFNDEYKENDSEELSIGTYMRDEVKGDNYIKENAGTLNSNTSGYTLNSTLYTAGSYINNSYLGYEFNLDLQFTYSARKGTVIAKYIDTEGNVLTEDITTTDMVGKNYKTEEKEFDGYTLYKIDGEEKGKYIDGTITVTYIYEPKKKEEIPVIDIPDDSNDELEITPPPTGTKSKSENLYLPLLLILSGTYLVVMKKNS